MSSNKIVSQTYGDTYHVSPHGAETMSELGDFLRKARETLDLTQTKVGAPLGISRNAVANWEAGSNAPDIKHVSQLASILKVDRDKLLKLIEAEKNVDIQPHPIELAVQPGTLFTGKPDLPVYAAAEGGAGAMIITWDPIDYIHRPSHLMNVKGAYAIYVVGESMVPRFEPGDVAFVNPHVRPRPGDDIVLFKQDGNGTTVGLIKRLVRVTSNEWVVLQYNPEKTFPMLKTEWPECYLVKGRV